MDLQKKIVAIIEESGIPSTKFADIIKVGRPTISHILSGRNNPSFDVIQKIIINFPELGTKWFLDGEELDTSILPQIAKNKGIEIENKLSAPAPEMTVSEPVRVSHEKIKSQEVKELSKTRSEEVTERNIEKIVIHYSDGSMEVLKGISRFII